MKNIVVLLIFFILGGYVAEAQAENYKELHSKIKYAELDTTVVYDLNDFTLEHQSLRVYFDSGQLCFFEPILLEGDTIYYAAYFKGEGKFYFKPPVAMEKDQLERFVGRDSVYNRFENVVLTFSQPIYQSLKKNLSVSEKSPSELSVKKADYLYRFDDDLHHTYHFQLLKSLLNPTPMPYLALMVDLKKQNDMIYIYNPSEREEINLLIKADNDNIELMNSFSQYNKTEDYVGVNGLLKDEINILNYDITADIDKNGVLSCTTKVRFEVKTSPLRLLEFDLKPSLKVTSIFDENSTPVDFKRYDLDISFKDYESHQVDLFFDQPLKYGDTTELTFIYQGEIAIREVGEFFVFAESDWYPRYGFRQLATYNMTFLSPDHLTFVATGNKISESKLPDRNVSRWKVSVPSANISFNIGYLKKFPFVADDVVPVDVYFSKDLHNSFAAALSHSLVAVGKDMQEQIANDVQNSLRVFNYYFGPYPHDRLTVGEILSSTSTAYPGFIHYGFDTWVNTDPWGYDRIHRAHEVAHQWWGAGVGYETYHDQWLSEGFATYSGLLYYQVIEKDKDKFLSKLKDYRTDIYSVRKYLLGSGEESGPIGLGYRTSTSKTRGDKNLIIYKKGAFILHMIRNLLIDFNTMNEDNFRYLLQDFYQLYRGKTANTRQFQQLVEKYTGIEMDWFFNQWVYQNQLPTYDFSYGYERDSTGAEVLKGKIITKNVNSDFKMYIPLEIQFEDENKAYLRLLVDQPEFHFTLPGLASRPKKLILNPFESVLAKVNQ